MSCGDCPICLEPLDYGRSRLTECGHEYHWDCIRKWHHHSQDLKCPTCRAESHFLKNVDQNLVVDLKKNSAANRVISEISEQVRHLALGTEASQRSWTLSTLECGICGALDSEINRYCTLCYSAYHEQCLRTLQFEVGDFSSRVYCCNCHGTFRDSEPERVGSASHRTGRLRRPIRSSPIAASAVLGGGEFEVDESWKLLSQLQQESRLLEHKRQIQSHVRKALHTHFQQSLAQSQSVSKGQFTDINKTVSRHLYRISGNVYQPETVNYDLEAQKLIICELAKIGKTDTHNFIHL
ncbi:LANO_0G10396g1_1 [Lachancea nothofagi CBS 11611]|uniref:LANO_0G10396g1_1 n=1 Tax=Lachancea nothofagi CBS 11611 TaxID=1266666 RepID=A0A1G4KJ12_9SACH|nr:LANO_0G10396g1_1 [Lachancea nothofagi CBS 11611]